MAESVKVIVRCRPLNERESNMKCKCVVEMSEEKGQCIIKKPGSNDFPPKQFTFDGAYFVESTTEQIYNDIAYPLVEGVVEGYNGTVFAYGQTGCGKSYSMQGVEDPSSQRGIIPRAFQHIFESIEVAENTKYLVHASYIEIYNEDIRDLLSSNIKHKLELKEHPDRGVYVRDLSMHPVSNVAECEQVMSSGWRNRSVGATLMNADSSRSHSIFTIYLEACDTGIDGGDHIRAGKLNLVDLAGSERQSKTGATGERLREATKINLSLSALGNVISALVDGKSKHIPYRDSKLTRLLQDSLGGNTKTLMVACLSPADNNYEETLSTLRYANRAKNIKNKPRINEDPKDALLREYQEEIKKLRGLLAGQLGPEGIKALLEGQSSPPLPKAPFKDGDDIREEKVHIDNVLILEFEQKINELKAKYEAEQMSNAKLLEDMNRLKSQYNQQNVQTQKIFGDDTCDNEPSIVYVSQLNTVSSAETGFCGSSIDNAESNSVTSSLQQREQFAQYIGTVENETDSMIYEQQREALKRLQLLQQSMVGGEKANDEAAKEIRRKRKKHVDERRTLLARAAKDDDEAIMLNVYDSIQDEVKARDKIIIRKDMQLEAARMEIEDVSYEFEQDRAEYLSTIRKQEREISFLQAIIDKIHPTIRRDCNYTNLDRVRDESSWNDEEQAWDLPELVVMKMSLPKAGASVCKNEHLLLNTSESYSQKNDTSDDDRLLNKLTNSSNKQVADNYFMPKRRVQSIVSSPHAPSTAKGFNTIGTHCSSSPMLGNGDSTPSAQRNQSSASSLSQVIPNESSQLTDFVLTRRPHRLDSLVPTNVGKPRKKKKK